MSITAVLAIFISLCAIPLAARPFTATRLLATLALVLIHIGASYYYYTYSLTAVADSYAYYFMPWIWRDPTIAISTVLVADMVQTLRISFQATYLDCFLLFQSFGLIGMMILARSFTEIEENLGVADKRGYIALLFLPSVNFWTAAIGKDSLLFVAISVCVWSVLKLRSRFIWFAASVGLMMLFRAHVALMAVAAMAIASIFGASVPIGRKVGMLAVALVGAIFAINAVESSIGVDVTSAADVGSFIDRQTTTNSTVAGTTSIGSAPFAFRLFSLLFRPFFFDANGFLGLVASVENLLILGAFTYLVMRWRTLGQLFKHVFFIRFAMIFAFFVLFSLTLVYYNVGLGLRQRVMAYPTIMSVLVAVWSMRHMANARTPMLRTPRIRGAMAPGVQAVRTTPGIQGGARAN